MQLLLDLDGVLVDFVRGVMRFHNTFIPYQSVQWAFDQTLLEGGAKAFWEPLGYEFWSTLPWTPNGFELLHGLISIVGHENICICTSPCQTEGGVEGKIRWMKKHLPKELQRSYMITPTKHFCTGDRILIDDREENVVDFRKGGGRAILVPQPWNTNSDKQDFGLEYVLDLTQRMVNT